eukprot:TRINITY_DN2032_c0_g1_i1.p1 TRINITY_DN2032_c0_g1~~TRINITY_DN2032_c0_g1_i1.p1  ORF type:complete len:265 (+),score=77.74 TRINITY_DN2032_c0_g1_i1:55-795(+)
MYAPPARGFNEPPPPYGNTTPPSRNSAPSPVQVPSPTMARDGTQVKLYNTNKERELYDNLADVYSIIKTMEHLEKAYMRDHVMAQEYAPACAKLIAQFKTAQSLIKDTVSLPVFLAEYKLECKMAMERFEKGYPATTEHHVTPDPTGNSSQRIVAETVQLFITTMDSLKLNLVAIDAIYPLVNDLIESLNRVPHLPAEFDGKVRIRGWLTVMHHMKASDELNPDQIRQLLFDLESAYNAFHKSLSG